MSHKVETRIHYIYFGMPTRDDHEVEAVEPQAVSLPAGAYGFFFYQRVSLMDTDGENLYSAASDQQISPEYYVGYRLRPAQAASIPGLDFLMEIIEGHEIDSVILLHNGAWVPFDEGDQVIDPAALNLKVPAPSVLQA